MKKILDEEVIQRLKSDKDRTVDGVLFYLHKQVYRMVVTFVKRYKGTQADAEEVFQDSLVALYKLARQGKLDDCSNVEAYLFAINKNLWFKELKKRKETVDIEEEATSIQVPDVALYVLLKEEKTAALEKLLSLVGENCQQLLVHYYYDRLKMKKIAEVMGYANEQVAKNKKSNCLKKLKELFVQLPQFKNIFT